MLPIQFLVSLYTAIFSITPQGWDKQLSLPSMNTWIKTWVCSGHVCAHWESTLGKYSRECVSGWEHSLETHPKQVADDARAEPCLNSSTPSYTINCLINTGVFNSLKYFHLFSFQFTVGDASHTNAFRGPDPELTQSPRLQSPAEDTAIWASWQ